MSIIPPLPYTLSNGALADASQVMANFNQIVSNVNANAAPFSSSIAALKPNKNGDTAGSILFVLSNDKNFTVQLSGDSVDSATSLIPVTFPYGPSGNVMNFKVPYAGTITGIQLYSNAVFGHISLDFNLNGNTLMTGGRITNSTASGLRALGNASSSPSANNICAVGDNLSVIINRT